MSAARLTEDQKLNILKRYSEGVHVKLIAKEFGVHYSYPTLLARRRGVTTRAGLENTRYQKEKVHV